LVVLKTLGMVGTCEKMWKWWIRHGVDRVDRVERGDVAMNAMLK